MQRRTAQLEAELEGVGEAEARQRARAERLVAEAGEAQAALLAVQAEKEAAREAALQVDRS